MFDVKETFGRLQLHLDHLDMDLSKYYNDFSMDEMVDWAEMEVEQQGGSSEHLQKTDKGKKRLFKMKQRLLKLGLILQPKAKRRLVKMQHRVLKLGIVDSDYNIDYNSDDDSEFCHVILSGGNLFEVRSKSEGFTVDEGKKTCGYRMWQLS
uniref:Transposon protein, putative, Mutator sub-class n=1 Tax=Tanacetum cinerariifolium TaxID=118510 RepID=A0A699IQ10_TANCI|nr:transposon protein, putative, Mutator sub-class [Tanacetum cinerariifolium]